jgi:hypothetical protein
LAAEEGPATVKGKELALRLIKLFSEGNGKLTGEQMQQAVLKGGTPDGNPFYTEDFIVSSNSAVEAAGIVLGR